MKYARVVPIHVRLAKIFRYGTWGAASSARAAGRAARARGLSAPNSAHSAAHTAPIPASTHRAERQPWCWIIQDRLGEETITPSVMPMVISAPGRFRLSLGNQDSVACWATGNAGPSAAPRNTREPISTASPPPMAAGTCATDQSTAITRSSSFGDTRSAAIPTTIAATENSRKNALLASPNWVALRCRSARISSAARPSTDLSAKLTIMKTTRSTVTVQARRPPGTAVSTAVPGTADAVVTRAALRRWRCAPLRAWPGSSR